MRKILLLVLLGAFLMSCTGDRGPAGPEGPPGAAIIYVEGVITAGYYDGEWIAITSSVITADALTQLYLSPNKETVAWQTVDFRFGNGVVFVYDPNRVYFLWDYLIMIIPNAGG